MKAFSDETLAALEAGDAIVGGAATIRSDPVIAVFSGYGELTIGGDVAQGIGDRGFAQASAGALGGSAQNVTFTLSGVDPEAVALVEADEVARAPVVGYRLIWNNTGKILLGAHVFARGKLDKINTKEVIGGPAAIEAVVENAARGLGRRGGRMRTDADQRLIKSTDGFFKSVSYAAEKQLYWGGKRPARAGTALGGAASAGAGTPLDDGNIRSVSA